MSQKRRPRRRSGRRPSPRRRGEGFSLKRLAFGRRIWILAALLVLALPAWVAWSLVGPGPAARSGDITTVILERGSGVSRIARTLQEAGVIRSAPLFIATAKATGAATSLKAGEYEVASGASLTRILADIRAGKVVRHYVTVPEGWTSAMALDAVMKQTVLTGEASAPPEGSILPDTYQVQRGETRGEVIARMRKARDALLEELWAKRQPGLPVKTPEEAVTLASIVEKETAIAAERPRIAAVFTNRLRTGMRLESDPTIIYGVSRGRPLGRGITLSELSATTPWNTYRIDGLPATPIANPGRQALEAVLDPPQTKELFFVADGTGGHVFAATYPEHLANVARWRRIEQSQARGAAR